MTLPLIVGLSPDEPPVSSPLRPPQVDPGRGKSTLHVVFPPDAAPVWEILTQGDLGTLTKRARAVSVVWPEPKGDRISALLDLGQTLDRENLRIEVQLALYGPQVVHDRRVGEVGHFDQTIETLERLGGIDGIDPIAIMPLTPHNCDQAFELWWWLSRRSIPCRATLDRSELTGDSVPYALLELLENLAHDGSLRASDQAGYQRLLDSLLDSPIEAPKTRLAGDVSLAERALGLGLVALPFPPVPLKTRLWKALSRYKVEQVRVVIRGALGSAGGLALGALQRRRGPQGRGASPPPRVLVVGWYGTETAGDKAILGGLWLELLKKMPELELAVASSLPFYTRQTLDELSLGRSQVVPFEPVTLAKQMDDYSLVLVGGGPLMDLAEMYHLLHIAVLAKRHGVPFAIAGCGIGPVRWRTTHWATKALVRQADAIILRDKDSRKILDGWGLPTASIRVGLDPALNYLDSLHLTQRSPGREDRPVLGMGIRDWQWKFGRALGRRQFQAKKSELTAKYAAICDRFVEELDGRVELIPMNTLYIGGDDRWIQLDVRALCKYPERVSVHTGVASAAETAGRIAGCDVFLSMRYHSMLFSTFLGVPTVALDYTLGGKISAYAQDSGLVQAVIDLASNWDPEFAFRSLRAALGQSDSYRRSLLEKRGGILRASALAGETAASLLDEWSDGRKGFE